MARKLRIGVVFGGRSGEHEISIRSAHSVINALSPAKYEVIPLALTRAGKWLAPEASLKLLPLDCKAHTKHALTAAPGSSVSILPDPTRKGLQFIGPDGHETRVRLDVVLPVLHGTFGEDGTVQGLLEMADLPYVGCGVLASASGMDKVVMKALLAQAGLAMCRYIWILRSDLDLNPQRVVRRIAKEIGYPCFVKPANLGSSVGVSKALDRKSLLAALTLAARYDRKIVIEELVDAREIECAVLGGEHAEASLPGEYVIKNESARFLDYTQKYKSTGDVKFVVPAPVGKAMLNRIRDHSVRAFQAVDGFGLARVDFFLKRDTGELLINEINTSPGLTDVSGYPKMWQASGRAFTVVLDQLIELALERHKDHARNSVTR